ncbi:MAG: multidrug effflux MFS transporter [Sutterellaceae bacterium]|nr:multidrug effflux MFS transporter [Sutterellaceae bacterium]MDD7441828.1 multidrug effflux MFS transporter [Sutterellaceae bacterium]MDY2867678.1 multidrug effflux MFS transporter [Mesosutterella sp.]
MLAMGISKTYLLWTLGLLTAFGPYVTDLYLASLPDQAEYFATSASLVQLGLTASMAGLAVGQLLIGPVSDHCGRKKPLLLSLVAFVVITATAIFSPNIESFLVLRFLQGVAGASGIVLSRSIATDLFSGKELMSAMGTMGAVNGIAPATAPVIGALLITVTDWRGIFVLLTLIGAALLVMSVRIPETLDPVRRNPRSPLAAVASLPKVFSDHGFALIILQQCFAFCVLFAYISSSPFIFQKIYGLTGLGFGICFGLNACGIGIGAALASRMTRPEKVLRRSSLVLLAFSILAGTALVLGAPFWLFEALLSGGLVTLGFTFPTAATLAMSRQRKQAGAASAILGAAGFFSGGIVSPLVGFGDIRISTAIALASSGVLAFAASVLVERFIRSEPASPEGEPLRL